MNLQVTTFHPIVEDFTITPNFLSDRQKKVYKIAKDLHKGQERKYVVKVPYWTHPLTVAWLVNNYSSKQESMLVEVALLHDVIEDCLQKYTEEQRYNILIERLNETGDYLFEEVDEIIRGVGHLTDQFTKEAFPDLNRDERKRREAIRLGEIPAKFQTVKYADLIHNLDSIVVHDPDFRVLYLHEKRRILNLMRAGDINLLMMACHQVYSAARSSNIVNFFEEI